MVDLAAPVHAAERTGPAHRARRGPDFGAFVAALVVAQALWLTGLGYGVYALAT